MTRPDLGDDSILSGSCLNADAHGSVRHSDLIMYAFLSSVFTLDPLDARA